MESSAGRRLASELVATIERQHQGLFDPYRDYCRFDHDVHAPSSRLARLAGHLACAPRFVLCGEAVGYQGCRYSGIAFTSERLLLEGSIPRISKLATRLSQRPLPFSEPSATIVWKTLYKLQIAAQTVLWNAVQLHPFRSDEPWSNRTPRPEEIALGQPALHLLRAAFPDAAFVAVGNKARDALHAAGIAAPAIRHPANGGATKFADGLKAIVERGGGRAN
jgi:hypothetical protein